MRGVWADRSYQWVILDNLTCRNANGPEANRNCPMFKSTSLAPSPVASTPQAPTPGFEYFGAPPTGGGGEQTPGTSFKIRLGAGR